MDIKEFCKIFAEETNNSVELCQPSTDYKQLENWGSLAAVLIIALADEQFGKDIDVKTFDNAKTLQDLYNVIINA